jgi:hypothetical protein
MIVFLLRVLASGVGGNSLRKVNSVAGALWNVCGREDLSGKVFSDNSSPCRLSLFPRLVRKVMASLASSGVMAIVGVEGSVESAVLGRPARSSSFSSKKLNEGMANVLLRNSFALPTAPADLFLDRANLDEELFMLGECPDRGVTASATLFWRFSSTLSLFIILFLADKVEPVSVVSFGG